MRTSHCNKSPSLQFGAGAQTQGLCVCQVNTTTGILMSNLNESFLLQERLDGAFSISCLYTYPFIVSAIAGTLWELWYMENCSVPAGESRGLSIVPGPKYCVGQLRIPRIPWVSK